MVRAEPRVFFTLHLALQSLPPQAAPWKIGGPLTLAGLLKSCVTFGSHTTASCLLHKPELWKRCCDGPTWINSVFLPPVWQAVLSGLGKDPRGPCSWSPALPSHIFRTVSSQNGIPRGGHENHRGCQEAHDYLGRRYSGSLTNQEGTLSSEGSEAPRAA